MSLDTSYSAYSRPFDLKYSFAILQKAQVGVVYILILAIHKVYNTFSLKPNRAIFFAVVFFTIGRKSMKKPLWLLFSLSLMIPTGLSAQTQDVHALSIVTRALEKAKRDNKIRENTAILMKTHWIGNLNFEGEFESVEKKMVYKGHTKDKGNSQKYIEELIDIWPPKSEPALSLLDFNKMLDAFLSRFYFLVSPEKELIDGRSHLKIHFWPRGDGPPPKEPADYLIGVITGILYVDEETLVLRRINGSLGKVIDESWAYVGRYYMDIFDFNIEITDWNELGLISRMNATARYQYKDPRKSFWQLFTYVKRYQNHRFLYQYEVE